MIPLFISTVVLLSHHHQPTEFLTPINSLFHIVHTCDIKNYQVTELQVPVSIGLYQD